MPVLIDERYNDEHVFWTICFDYLRWKCSRMVLCAGVHQCLLVHQNLTVAHLWALSTARAQSHTRCVLLLSPTSGSMRRKTERDRHIYSPPSISRTNRKKDRLFFLSFLFRERHWIDITERRTNGQTERPCPLFRSIESLSRNNDISKRTTFHIFNSNWLVIRHCTLQQDSDQSDTCQRVIDKNTNALGWSAFRTKFRNLRQNELHYGRGGGCTTTGKRIAHSCLLENIWLSWMRPYPLRQSSVDKRSSSTEFVLWIPRGFLDKKIRLWPVTRVLNSIARTESWETRA